MRIKHAVILYKVDCSQWLSSTHLPNNVVLTNWGQPLRFTQHDQYALCVCADIFPTPLWLHSTPAKQSARAALGSSVEGTPVVLQPVRLVFMSTSKNTFVCLDKKQLTGTYCALILCQRRVVPPNKLRKLGSFALRTVKLIYEISDVSSFVVVAISCHN